MRGIRWVVAALAGLLLLLLLPAGAGAASLEPVGSFDRPIYVTSDPEDPDRLFVVERQGRIQLHENGVTSEMADLTSLVLCCVSEQGLHSLAAAPDFETSGLIYVVYTGVGATAGGEDGDVHVDAFEVSGDTIDVESTRRPILTVDHSTRANHNGGQLQFGPDGYLYISLGDGGGAGDPDDNAQDPGTLAGSLLRIDPRPDEEPPGYAIPPGNPFEDGEGGALSEIWAYGLRNPWRFSFDRETGDMVIADVGQGTREEVNFAPSPAPGVIAGAGANYGWDCREGLIEYPNESQQSPACEGLGVGDFTHPVFDYPHDPDPDVGGQSRCSITGGYVVRDAGVEDLYGRYVYGDYCGGQLRSIDLSDEDPGGTDRVEAGLSVPIFSLYSFGEDSCGRVYVVSTTASDEDDDVVYRLEGDEPADCPEAEEPEPDPGEPEPEPDETEAEPDPGSSANPPPTPVRTRVRARAGRRLVRRGRRVGIAVWVRPCAGNRGRPVLLNRGGRRSRVKRLNRRCIARFGPRMRTGSSFRALFRPRGARRFLRSPRVIVRVR